MQYRLKRHLEKGCTCCQTLKDQLELLEVSSEAIHSMAGKLLQERKRLLRFEGRPETIEHAIHLAVSIAKANHPHLNFIAEVSGSCRHVQITGATEVLSNLLKNSAEASKPGQSIWIRASDTGSAIELVVKDQGTGIPDEILQQIKQGNTVTNKSNGNGLGVSSMLNWAAEQGYTVEITSSHHGTESVTQVLMTMLT